MVTYEKMTYLKIPDGTDRIMGICLICISLYIWRLWLEII